MAGRQTFGKIHVTGAKVKQWRADVCVCVVQVFRGGAHAACGCLEVSLCLCMMGSLCPDGYLCVVTWFILEQKYKTLFIWVSDAALQTVQRWLAVQDGQKEEAVPS